MDPGRSATWDARLVSWLYCFNVTHDYFECHEYAESLWLDTGRPVVLKGLIQAAVCLYHLQNGNVRGGWRMWQRARSYLQPSLPTYEGIDLEHLVQAIDAVFSRVPADWRSQQVPERAVAELCLPVVTVQVVDPLLQLMVAQWTLPPLPEK